MTILDGLIQLAGLFFLQETYAPVLLERRAHQLRKQMGLGKEEGKRLVQTSFDDGSRHWKNIFAHALTRPFVMFLTEPIVSLLGVYQAFVYGLFLRLLLLSSHFASADHSRYGMMYLMLTTLPSIFASPPYSESIGIAGLHYIALGIGFTFASQFNARFIDFIYKYLKKRNNGVGKPEFRLRESSLLLTHTSVANYVGSKHAVRDCSPSLGIVPLRMVSGEASSLDSD